MEEKCYELTDKAIILETPLHDFVVVYVVKPTGVILFIFYFLN